MALLRQACRMTRKCCVGSQNILLSSPMKESSTYTDYEVTQSAEEWKYVERLLPQEIVPPPPEHEIYPTPSGWVPPAEKATKLVYTVRRTRNHNLPVYFQQRNTRKLTQVKGIDGDIWAFEADLRTYLEPFTEKKLYTQVNEITRQVWIKGSFGQHISDFLVQQGF